MTQAKFALSMSGGGARAAYQVGLLRHIAREHPEFYPTIITGVSAGAVNAVHLASHRGEFQTAVNDLYGLWKDLRMENVFHADSSHMLKSFLRWGMHFLLGGTRFAPKTRSMLDSDPLREYLAKKLGSKPHQVVPGIDQNIASGRLQVLGVTTSNYTIGKSITWTHGYNPDPWERPRRRSTEAKITVEHVMASAALPLIFPAIQLGDHWHGDGGIRLIAPLSPAMHYGADRILAISTRRGAGVEGQELEPMTEDYPPAAQIISAILNAVFLDVFDYDATNMERINELYEFLPPEQQSKIRRTKVLVVRPSRDLARIAAELELKLPASFRYFARGFGTKETKSPDSLSMLMFFPEYINELIAMGEADADAQREEIAAFIND